jgi:hypothetical protein
MTPMWPYVFSYSSPTQILWNISYCSCVILFPLNALMLRVTAQICTVTKTASTRAELKQQKLMCVCVYVCVCSPFPHCWQNGVDAGIRDVKVCNRCSHQLYGNALNCVYNIDVCNEIRKWTDGQTNTRIDSRKLYKRGSHRISRIFYL